jgi:hypothetical protein
MNSQKTPFAFLTEPTICDAHNKSEAKNLID